MPERTLDELVKATAKSLRAQKQKRFSKAESPRDLSDEDLHEYVCSVLEASGDAWTEGWFRDFPPAVRAFIATADLESEVGNGGLYQYFLNREDEPWLLGAAIEGYAFFGLHELAQMISDQILPLAMSENEKKLRDYQRRNIDHRLATMSRLNPFDDVIGDHTELRVALVRANPGLFGAEEWRPPRQSAGHPK